MEESDGVFTEWRGKASPQLRLYPSASLSFLPTRTLQGEKIPPPARATSRAKGQTLIVGLKREHEYTNQSPIFVVTRHSSEGRDVRRYGCGKKPPTKALENPLKPAGSVLNRAEEKKRRRRRSSAFHWSGIKKYGEGMSL